MKLFLSIVVFSLFLLGLHLVILYFLDGLIFKTVLFGHLFFFVMTTLVLAIFSRAVALMFEKAGFIFIQAEFIKALALIVFLLLLRKSNMLDNSALANLLSIYLCHLFFSVFLGVKMLHRNYKNISRK